MLIMGSYFKIGYDPFLHNYPIIFHSPLCNLGSLYKHCGCWVTEHG